MLLIVCDKTKRKTEERLKKTHIESDFGGSSARNWFPRSRSESAAWSLLVMFQIVLDCPSSCSDWLHDESNSVSGFEHPGIGRESTTRAKYVFAKSQLDRTLDLFCVQVKLKICLCVIVPSDDSARECFFNECILPPRQDWRLTMIGGKI